MNRFGQPNVVGERLTTRYRKLPHWQCGGSTYFITFRSALGNIPGLGLGSMRDHLRQSQGTTHEIPFGVVMPNHVHLLLRPREIAARTWADLGKIMKLVKGGGARRINLALGRNGSVWQDESYDRIVRDEHEFQEKWHYMWENPARAGLVADPDDYPFFVRGAEQAASDKAWEGYDRLKSVPPGDHHLENEVKSVPPGDHHLENEVGTALRGMTD